MAAIGLVLGAGGMVGHAYHAGTLAALHDVAGWNANDADVVVGTSAGSVVGAILRAGMAPEDLFARVVGAPLSAAGRRLIGASGDGQPADLGGAAFSLTNLRPASPRLLARAALRPWTTRLGLLTAGALPLGRVSGAGIRERINAVHDQPWPDRALWITAVRLGDGARVVFGRDDRVIADVGTAVQASSAIPGFFAPVEIDGELHVDGGAHSPTNADLLADLGLDLVIVVSPMSVSRRAARRPDPTTPIRLAHRLALDREVRSVRATGTEVITIQPDPDDLAVMGRNAMDPARREPVARQARVTARRRLEEGRAGELLAAALGKSIR